MLKNHRDNIYHFGYVCFGINSFLCFLVKARQRLAELEQKHAKALRELQVCDRSFRVPPPLTWYFVVPGFDHKIPACFGWFSAVTDVSFATLSKRKCCDFFAMFETEPSITSSSLGTVPKFAFSHILTLVLLAPRSWTSPHCWTILENNILTLEYSYKIRNWSYTPKPHMFLNPYEVYYVVMGHMLRCGATTGSLLP